MTYKQEVEESFDDCQQMQANDSEMFVNRT